MQAFHTIDARFDDPNLIGVAGLVPLMLLAERAGLHTLLGERLSVPSPNAAVKASSVIAGMLAGADSIDDCDVLRHGAMGKVLTGTRAPSTLGTFLRTFTFGHVRQLDAVASRTLAGLAQIVPQLLTGATTPDGMAFVDIDDTIRETHGYKKQGVAYGYSGVKGLNAQVATISSPTCAPGTSAASVSIRAPESPGTTSRSCSSNPMATTEPLAWVNISVLTHHASAGSSPCRSRSSTPATAELSLSGQGPIPCIVKGRILLAGGGMRPLKALSDN